MKPTPDTSDDADWFFVECSRTRFISFLHEKTLEMLANDSFLDLNGKQHNDALPIIVTRVVDAVLEDRAGIERKTNG